MPLVISHGDSLYGPVENTFLEQRLSREVGGDLLSDWSLSGDRTS